MAIKNNISEKNLGEVNGGRIEDNGRNLIIRDNATNKKVAVVTGNDDDAWNYAEIADKMVNGENNKN